MVISGLYCSLQSWIILFLFQILLYLRSCLSSSAGVVQDDSSISEMQIQAPVISKYISSEAMQGELLKKTLQVYVDFAKQLLIASGGKCILQFPKKISIKKMPKLTYWIQLENAVNKHLQCMVDARITVTVLSIPWLNLFQILKKQWLLLFWALHLRLFSFYIVFNKSFFFVNSFRFELHWWNWKTALHKLILLVLCISICHLSQIWPASYLCFCVPQILHTYSLWPKCIVMSVWVLLFALWKLVRLLFMTQQCGMTCTQKHISKAKVKHLKIYCGSSYLWLGALIPNTHNLSCKMCRNDFATVGQQIYFEDSRSLFELKICFLLEDKRSQYFYMIHELMIYQSMIQCVILQILCI